MQEYDPNRRRQSRRFEDELLQWLGAGSGEVLTVVGADGELSYVSRAAQRILGWFPQELVGRPAASLYHPDDLQSLDLSSVKPDRRHAPRLRCRHRDGTWREVESQVRPLVPIAGDNGRAVVVLTRDVTREARAIQDLRHDNARLRTSARQSQRFLDRLPIGVAEVSLGGRIQRVNSWIAELLGRTEEELVGRTLGDLLPALGIESVRTADPGDPAASLEFSVLKPDGTRNRVRATSRLEGLDGEEADTLVLLVAQVSGTTAPDRRNGPTPDTVAAIHSSIRALQGRVDDLVLLAGLREGQLAPTPTPVDLVPIVRRVLQEFRAAAEDKSLHLVIDMPEELEVVGSAPLLSSVMRHLVDNAIRFTDAGQVTVSAAVGVDEVQVAVEDTGPGLNPEDGATMLEQFTVADPATSLADSEWGIGLGLVGYLVQIQDGVCGVADRDGAGASIWFKLPGRA